MTDEERRAVEMMKVMPTFHWNNLPQATQGGEVEYLRVIATTLFEIRELLIHVVQNGDQGGNNR